MLKRSYVKKMLSCILTLAIIISTMIVGMVQTNAASDKIQIHYLALPAGDYSSLAVLLECNGHFGMIDAGEDTDYPDEGSIYWHPGFTTAQGNEEGVINYLKQAGVNENNFDFFIGTHSHSDHIAAADEVINEFKPKKVYLQEYKDEYIRDLDITGWDNLYIYEQAIEAANNVGATIIQDINSSNANFTLGTDMEIEIKNYGKLAELNYRVDDANDYSLGVLIKANGKSVFVGGDINNYNGHETELTKELGHVDVLTLGHHGYKGSNSTNYLTGLNPDIIIIPGKFGTLGDERLDTVIGMNLGNYNNGKRVKVYATSWFSENKDMKYDVGSLTLNFDDEFTNNIPDNYVNNSEGYCIKNGLLTIPAAGLSDLGNYYYDGTSYKGQKGTWVGGDGKPWKWCYGNGNIFENGWMKDNGNWFYFENGILVENSFREINGYTYYLKDDGYLAQGMTEANDGKTYYFTTEHDNYADSTKPVGSLDGGLKHIGKNYYLFDSDGVLQSDNQTTSPIDGTWKLNNVGWWWERSDSSYPVSAWKKIDGYWYYFDSEGYAATGWQMIDGAWYYLHPSKYTNGSGVTFPQCSMAEGWIKDGSVWYYLDPSSGAMQTGWQLIDGNWYYLNANGSMYTGWLKDGATWYYLDPLSGKML